MGHGPGCRCLLGKQHTTTTMPVLKEPSEPPPSAAPPPVPKPPVADHIVCMECGAHLEHGWVEKHYASLHPLVGMTDDEIRRLAHNLHVSEQAKLIRDAVDADPGFYMPVGAEITH